MFDEYCTDKKRVYGGKNIRSFGFPVKFHGIENPTETDVILKNKNRAEVLQNQVATLDTMYQDAQIMIQENTLDLKECQKSYDELLLELDLTADSLVECRKAQTKVVSPRKASRFTKFVKN